MRVWVVQASGAAPHREDRGVHDPWLPLTVVEPCWLLVMPEEFDVEEFDVVEVPDVSVPVLVVVVEVPVVDVPDWLAAAAVCVTPTMSPAVRAMLAAVMPAPA